MSIADACGVWRSASVQIALVSSLACTWLFGCAPPKREAYVWQDPEPPPDPAIVVLDGGPVGDEFEVRMSSPRGASWDVKITNKTVEGLEVVWVQSHCVTATGSRYSLETKDDATSMPVELGATVEAVVFPPEMRGVVEQNYELEPGSYIRGATCALVFRAQGRDMTWRASSPPPRSQRRTEPVYAPAPTPSYSSGGCKKGCRCGNSCISCAKTCRK